MKPRTLFFSPVLLLTVALFAQFPSYRFDVGWNLIGGGSTPFSATDIDSLEQIIPPVYSYNTETSAYVAADTVQPLSGYWVLSMDSFTVGSGDCDCPPTVTDIDGNVYETVLIGGQCWMAENLKTAHYRDGSPIPQVTYAPTWEGLSSGAYCAHNNDPSNIATYGLLYNWYAVDDAHVLAPEGWHVATDEEWKQLEISLGMESAEADEDGWRGTDEGSRMAGGYSLWIAGDMRENPAFGESGLSVLPASYRYNTGVFSHLNASSCCWSSSGFVAEVAWSRLLSSTSSGVGRSSIGKSYGYSVRCVMD